MNFRRPKEVVWKENVAKRKHDLGKEYSSAVTGKKLTNHEVRAPLQTLIDIKLGLSMEMML